LKKEDKEKFLYHLDELEKIVKKEEKDKDFYWSLMYLNKIWQLRDILKTYEEGKKEYRGL